MGEHWKDSLPSFHLPASCFCLHVPFRTCHVCSCTLVRQSFPGTREARRQERFQFGAAAGTALNLAFSFSMGDQSYLTSEGAHGVGDSGGAEVTTGGILQLSPEQLRQLRRDELANLASVLASAVHAQGSSAAGDGVASSTRVYWHLETFSEAPPAPLRFRVWQTKANEWLSAHSQFPQTLRRYHLRAALQGEASSELARIDLKTGQDEFLADTDLLNELERAYVPRGTVEAAQQRLRAWRAVPGDILSSSRRFLDDVVLADVSVNALTGWETYYRQGLPIDLQQRVHLRAEHGTIKELYELVQDEVEKLRTDWLQTKLPRAQAALSFLDFAIPQHSNRTLRTEMRTKESSSLPQDSQPFCKFHQQYGHKTSDCHALSKRVQKEGKPAKEILFGRKFGGSSTKADQPSTNFRPFTGPK